MPLTSKEVEAETVRALFDAARSRQSGKSSSPRFLLEGARCMARHLGLDAPRMGQLLPQLAFWQMYLPSVLAADTHNFTAARTRLPWSYERLHAALETIEDYPQVVIATFHMAAIPLMVALFGLAWREVHRAPGHIVLASRNIAWTMTESGRWTREIGEVIGTSSSDLRRLLTGLRSGELRRLMVLVDGPHPPGRPGTRALANLSPALGFKTGLLRSILDMGIPVLPLAHYWEDTELVLEWGPPLTSDGESQIAGILEELLRRHPEQWLNWTAASLRT